MGLWDKFRKRPSSERDVSVTSDYVSPPNSIREDSDPEEVEVEVEEYEGIRHPSRIGDILNLRLVSGNSVAPDTKPTLRITMMAEPRRADGFMFDPIEFDLIEGGPSIRFARIPKHYRTNDVVIQEPGRILFKSRTVTRGSHAQIWCEGGQVFVQDTGSSASTQLNGRVLAHALSTVSIPHRLESGDILQLGKDYTKVARSTVDPNVFKCVRALILIENIRVREKSQEPVPRPKVQLKIAPESKPEEETGPASITFDCQPYCSCPWRTLFHEKGIYSLDLNVSGPETISSAIESWLLRQPSVNEKWGDWKEEDAVALMSVIERIIGAMKTSPAHVVQCQSWIRKIARHTGALPDTFVLKGVARTSPHPVGGGGFADIYRGRYKGQETALKVLRVFITHETKRKIFRDVIHEALFWKHLNHPHILPFLGISQDAIVPHLCLVSPWMAHGDILNYIDTCPEVDRLSLIAQCSHGLRYLHDYNPGLVHGDIKGANILIDGDGNARITDFGLITITESQAIGTSFTVDTDRGSVRWMAPELLTSSMRKNRSTDVYAFGMTVLEIYTNSPPFADYTNNMQIIVAITRGARPSRPAFEQIKMYEELWTLTNRCWDVNPDIRPSMREVVNNLDSLLTRRARGLLSFTSDTASRPSLNPFRNLQSYPSSNISATSSDTQVTVFSAVYSDLSGTDLTGS